MNPEQVSLSISSDSSVPDFLAKRLDEIKNDSSILVYAEPGSTVSVHHLGHNVDFDTLNELANCRPFNAKNGNSYDSLEDCVMDLLIVYIETNY